MVTGKPYQHKFSLQNFNRSQTFKGSYIFPFKILLPSQLPGSFFYDQQNFIRYMIFAQLENQNKQKFLSYKKKIHLIEPFRKPLQQINQSIKNYPQCCGCCESYGVVCVKFSCNKNYFKTRQNLQIFCQIDNTHGKIPIRNAQIYLNQYLCKVSPNRLKNQISLQSLLIKRFDQLIRNETTKSVNFIHTVSSSFSKYSTAIGTIFATYFTLSLKSQMGICSGGANIEIRIFFEAQNPFFEENLKLQSQSFFSSTKTFPLFIYTNMRSFIYSPIQGQPYLNRENFSPHNNLFGMDRPYSSPLNKQSLYEIKKISDQKKNKFDINSEKNQNNKQRNKVNNNIECQEKNERKRQENKRQEKYMDKQSQDDYIKVQQSEQNINRYKNQQSPEK